VQNVQIGVVWGHLGVTQGHQHCHHLIERIDFLFDFNRNHASILNRFPDTAGYLSKVADFEPPHLHLPIPVGGDPGRISRKSLAGKKCSVPGLLRGVVCVILRLAVLVEH